MPSLDIAAPLPHQLPSFNAPVRFKVLRGGRRGGKTREIYTAGMIGHGPGWDTGQPMFPGVLQGWDVVWIARDIPQGKVIWREEIEPRFRELESLGTVSLNRTEHIVTIHGVGSLHLRSNENISSVRGLGKRLKGVICDEAAWFDLETAWREVLRPMLMDNEGWAFIASTTNAGFDGNQEHQVPSFFNRLCADIQSGKRDSDWGEWYYTARDNPKINPVEFEKLVAEYPEDSIELAQEVYAHLTDIGVGLVFPELKEEYHLVQSGAPHSKSRTVASADWGWVSPAATLWISTDQGLGGLLKSRVHREWWPTETLPSVWAEETCQLLKLDGGEVCDIDSAVNQKKQDGSPTIYEQMLPTFRKHNLRLRLIEKGPDSITHGVQLLHTYFWTNRGQVQPLLTISNDCRRLWDELRLLRRGNPKERVSENPNVPAPYQSDHGFDALRYWAMARPRPAELTIEDRLKLDPVMTRALQDDATRVEVTRRRIAEAAQKGQMVPPKAPPLKFPPQTRKPWERR